MKEIFLKKAKESIKYPLYFLVILWAIRIFSVMTGTNLTTLGIYPRDLESLPNILSGPFIHGSWTHLINNSIPFFIGSFTIMQFYRKVALKSFFTIYIITGLMVWVFAKSAFHIGLSGIVYGLISFIFWNGIFRRNLKSIILALIVIFMYSGMIYGILPNQPGISWESHLFGTIAGAITSFLFQNQIEKDEVQTTKEPEQHEEDFFFERDLFEQPKREQQYRR